MTSSSLISLQDRIRSDFDELTTFILKLDSNSQILDGNTIHFDVFATLQRTAKTCMSSQILSKAQLYSSALASCRTAVEQLTSNFLNLRAEGVFYYLPFTTDELALEWISKTRMTLSDTSEFSFVGDPQRCQVRDKRPCVPVIHRNVLTVDSGTRKVPFPGVRLLSVVDMHRLDHSAKGDFFRGHAYPYVGDRNARIEQKHRYEHHFKWSSLLKAVRSHGLFDVDAIERLDRHYSYLSLFSHGTPNTDGYLLLRQSNQEFEKRCLELLIDLYCYCILYLEVQSLDIYEKTSCGIISQAGDLIEIQKEKFKLRLDVLGFLGARPHEYDLHQESSYRASLKFSSGESGFLREDHRPHFDVDLFRRIQGVFRSMFSFDSGSPYEPPFVP